VAAISHYFGLGPQPEEFTPELDRPVDDLMAA
jgi:hypothetical protein